MTTDRDIRLPVRLVECGHGSEFGSCPVDGCTHSGAPQDPVSAVEAGPVPASHWGRCGTCGATVVPNSPIVKVDGCWIHEECC